MLKEIPVSYKMIARKFSKIITNINFKSKKTPFIILGITAVACSKILFLFFNDPEGANLLVVMGMALIVYFLSLTVYLLDHSMIGSKKLLLAILIQIMIVIGFYFYLN